MRNPSSALILGMHGQKQAGSSPPWILPGVCQRGESIGLQAESSAESGISGMPVSWQKSCMRNEASNCLVAGMSLECSALELHIESQRWGFQIKVTPPFLKGAGLKGLTNRGGPIHQRKDTRFLTRFNMMTPSNSE